MAKSKKPAKAKNPDARPDDDGLWQGVAAGVRPITGREFLAGSALADEKLPAPAPAPAKKTKKTQRQAKAPAPVPPQPGSSPLPPLSHESQPGLDRATMRKMARGKVKIEARLDLHGMTQAEAQPRLEGFIERAFLQGKRDVLVITGKGTRADGSIGVLRQMVPDWLNTEPNRSRISAFRHAAVPDGGEGALYIRIRKSKP